MRGDDVEECVEAAGRRRRWMRRAMTTTAAGAAALLALSGCGPSEEELAAQAEEDQLAAPLEVAWESNDELISYVEETEDVALAYVAGDGMMELLARDIESGEELWRKPALFGNENERAGAGLPLVEHDGTQYTSYYAPSEDGPGHHEVVDVETGERLRSRLTQETFADRPYTCGETFCAEGEWWYQDGDSGYFAESQEIAFDWGSERWTAREQVDGTEDEDAPPVTEDADRLGPHLSISKPDESEESLIGYGADGEIRWERPYTEVLGHENTEDRSVRYTDGGEDDPLILSAWPYGGDGEKKELGSLTSTLRLDVSTGETLWKAENAHLSCDYAALSSDELIDADPTVAVACGYDAGTRTFSQDGDGQMTWEDQDVDQYVVGLDIETGEQEWRVDIDAAADVEEPERGVVNDVRYEEVPSRDGETTTIDLVTGESVTSREAYEPTTFCWKDREPLEMRRYTEREDGTWSTGDDLADVERYGSRFPCDRDEQTAVDEMPTVAELRRIGHDDEDGVAVVRGPDGMVGYEIPALEEFREDA